MHRSMLKIFTSILLIFLILSCSESSTGTDNEISNPVERPDAPNFTSSTFNNSTFSLADYSGKVVYIFFLGSTCSICKAAGPTTNDIYEKYNPQDVQVLGLDVWDGTAGQVSSFITVTGIEYPVGMDASQIGAEYGVVRDYSVIIDKNGRIAYKKEHVVMHDITQTIDALILE